MRTWLFVPGHDARKTQKALQSAAEAVIIDWEDAVPPERKQEARSTTRELLAQAAAGPRRIVRINNSQDPAFADDLAALAGLPIAGVLLPKASSALDVLELARSTALPIIPILETALGIELAFEIAKAHIQVERLAFGALDFMADMGVLWSVESDLCQLARARIALAGRAAELAGPIDSVYPQLNDDEGLRHDAARARACGFVGKFLIHPAQIPVVRQVFSPSAQELAQASEIIEAFAQARARGESAVRLGAKFIDPPVVRWAEQVLALGAADAA